MGATNSTASPVISGTNKSYMVEAKEGNRDNLGIRFRELRNTNGKVLRNKNGKVLRNTSKNLLQANLPKISFITDYRVGKIAVFPLIKNYVDFSKNCMDVLKDKNKLAFDNLFDYDRYFDDPETPLWLSRKNSFIAFLFRDHNIDTPNEYFVCFVNEHGWTREATIHKTYFSETKPADVINITPITYYHIHKNGKKWKRGEKVEKVEEKPTEYIHFISEEPSIFGSKKPSKFGDVIITDPSKGATPTYIFDNKRYTYTDYKYQQTYNIVDNKEKSQSYSTASVLDKLNEAVAMREALIELYKICETEYKKLQFKNIMWTKREMFRATGSFQIEKERLEQNMHKETNKASVQFNHPRGQNQQTAAAGGRRKRTKRRHTKKR